MKGASIAHCLRVVILEFKENILGLRSFGGAKDDQIFGRAGHHWFEQALY
jgi:hypothetical protein